MQLRDYEIEWLTRIRQTPGQRVLIVGPTGIGKTVVGATLIAEAYARGEPCLVVVHRRELADQMVLRLCEAGLPRDAIGVIVGSHPRHLERRIQVASVQALQRLRRKPLATVLVVDEAHHAPAPSYRALWRAYPESLIYGLTATPYRMDGQPLGDLFDDLVCSAAPSELPEWLRMPLVFTQPLRMQADLSRARLQAGDYHPEDLERAVNRRPLVGSIVQHWDRYADGRATVCYAVSRKHARAITEAFKRVKVRAVMLDGHTPAQTRRAYLAGLQSDKVEVVVNCMVLTEGWDSAVVKCAIIARPTRSEGLWLQMAGRVTRPYEQSAKDPIILDHAGNALLHPLPLQDREYSLHEQRPLVFRHGEAPAKECPACGSALSPGLRLCPFCKHEFWQAWESPPVLPGELELAKGPRLCSYAMCPTPMKRLQLGSTRMHRNCAHVSEGKPPIRPSQFCSYDKCPTPMKRLKRVQGIDNKSGMHWNCARVSEDKPSLVHALRVEGLSERTISVRLGIPRSTLSRWKNLTSSASSR